MEKFIFCEVSVRKDVLRKLAKVTGKHLCQSLFLNKVAGSGTFFTEHLRMTASELRISFKIRARMLFFNSI